METHIQHRNALGWHQLKKNVYTHLVFSSPDSRRCSYAVLREYFGTHHAIALLSCTSLPRVLSEVCNFFIPHFPKKPDLNCCRTVPEKGEYQSEAARCRRTRSANPDCSRALFFFHVQAEMVSTCALVSSAFSGRMVRSNAQRHKCSPRRQRTRTPVTPVMQMPTSDSSSASASNNWGETTGENVGSMSELQTIEFIIRPGGAVEERVTGVKGEACEKVR